MSERLSVPGDPVADPRAVVMGDRWRITVLTPGLVRLEWAEDGVFEDRASTFAVDRHLPVPDFGVRRGEDLVEIDTDCLHLEYDGLPFSPSGLKITVRSSLDSKHTSVWRHGEAADGLGGTARTLDKADGAVPLGPGVVSRSGIAVLDDSASFLLEGGRPATRRPGTRDLYVFARGTDYRAAVADLQRVGGATPLLPRWALGNWWSRYHAYSAAEYLELLDRFEDEQVPLSVAVLDMDWHWVDIDPRHGVGWTGYSWNTDLFPDPAAFLAELHERGLRTTLNVHPADGVRSFEDAYPRLARAVGIDPDSGQTVAFDPTDETFLDAYFELLHHPLEDQGVDFWWLDWQQGGHSRMPGVDPLWLLNIAHFNDSGRRGGLPLTFSRFAGPGSHRYPVGFSGDTVISWESLAFQPEFTATASNIGYGWWSHDVGGHLPGVRDDELHARWVQLGCFSPISRLHSTEHRFIRKEPWAFRAVERDVVDRYLRLRHRLLPYLHTMNHRAAQGSPLTEPMYWEDPSAEGAYRHPHQFRFGTELVVAPIVSPADPELLLGSTRAWLPPGEWTDLFTGTRYTGDRDLRLYRPLEQLPVLLQAGSLLPLAGGEDAVVGVAHPAVVELVLVPGADGAFDLLEDDGSREPALATTPLRFEAATGTLRIGPATGDTSLLPDSRTWRVHVLGAQAAVSDATGATVEAQTDHVGTRFCLGAVEPGGELVASLSAVTCFGWDRTVGAVGQLLERAQLPFATKQQVHDALDDASGPLQATARLRGLELPEALEDAVLELVLALAADR